jgi:hypothetical protein
LLEFFRDADVSAELVRGGCLVINGHQTLPLVKILPTPERLDWEKVINAMAVSYAAEKFIAVVADSARFDEGFRVFLRRPEKAFVVMRDDAELAIIRATRAEITGREAVRANFMKPGPHWQQVADIIHSAEPELLAMWRQEQETRDAAAAAAVPAESERRRATAAAAAERVRATARRRIDELPSDFPPDLLVACLDASRRIRLERQVAYDRPVVLQCKLGDLSLLPITGAQNHMLVPFRLTTGTGTLAGELVLGDSDPLPVLISQAASDLDAISVWTCALFGFADATCIELDSAEFQRRREPATRRQSQQARPRQHRPTARTLPRKRQWPSHLTPVGQWTEHVGSFVAGHRRRLNEDQTASPDAVDRARQVGITLHPGETWVRAHARGLPDGVEMRFQWRTPPSLKRSMDFEAPRSAS